MLCAAFCSGQTNILKAPQSSLVCVLLNQFDILVNLSNTYCRPFCVLCFTKELDGIPSGSTDGLDSNVYSNYFTIPYTWKTSWGQGKMVGRIYEDLGKENWGVLGNLTPLPLSSVVLLGEDAC